MTIRLIIADDHPLIRIGLRMLLKDKSEISLIAEANSSIALLNALHHQSADLLITDFSMPDGETPDGLGLIQRLRRDHRDLPIIVLTMISNAGVHASILRSGVRGLVDKSSDIGEVVFAIDAVTGGRDYVSPSFRKGLFEMTNPFRDGMAARLSPRETEVLRLFASGLTVSSISKRLSRSVKTVSSQKSVAMMKLGLKSDYEIFFYAREHGMEG
jgi:two-component system capsular synthesis response regulator RcsB